MVHKAQAFEFLVLGIPICAFYAGVLYVSEAPTPFIFFITFVAAMIVAIYVNFAFSKELQDAMKALYDECDPESLYNVSCDAIKYTKGVTQQDLILNQSAALFFMGKHEEVVELLENLNIDKISGTLLQSKITYYNNLASAYLECGQYDKALQLFGKVRILYRDAPQKLQKQFEHIIICIDADESVYAGNYEKALEVIKALQSKDQKPLQKISAVYGEGEIYFKMGKYEKALPLLHYVYMNGGRTFYVDRALKLIHEIKEKKEA